LRRGMEELFSAVQDDGLGRDEMREGEERRDDDQEEVGGEFVRDDVSEEDRTLDDEERVEMEEAKVNRKVRWMVLSLSLPFFARRTSTGAD
jgi:hypothetical protein